MHLNKGITQPDIRDFYSVLFNITNLPKNVNKTPTVRVFPWSIWAKHSSMLCDTVAKALKTDMSGKSYKLSYDFVEM